LLWTDRVDGECCVVVVSVADSAELLSSSDSEDEVVVSFAVSVELPHSVEGASCPRPLCSGVELMWTDRIDGESCVVVSVELLWIDGESCAVVSFADSADEVVVPHSSSSKSTSSSDNGNATLRVTFDDVIAEWVLGLCLCVVVLERKSIV
jgi:hypothetical protein